MANWYKIRLYGAFALWAGVAAIDVTSVTTRAFEVPPSLNDLALSVAVVLSLWAAIGHLDRRTIVPIREAFVHGYRLRGEHEQRRLDTDDTEAIIRAGAVSNGAQIIRIPPAVYTAGTNPEPLPVQPIHAQTHLARHRNRAPHQRRLP